MKKAVSIGIVCIMLLGLVGCADKEKQQAITDYVDAMAVVGQLENSLLESYTSVMGENYTDDNAVYTELQLNTLSRAQTLNSEAVRLAESLTDEEVKEVHALYVEYSSAFLEAMNLLKQAIEQQDADISAQGQQKLNNANTFALEYQTKLQSLAEKYEVNLLAK